MKKLLLFSILVTMYSQSFSQNLAMATVVKENKSISSATNATNATNPAIIEFQVSWLKTDQLDEVKSEDIEKDQLFGENISKKKYLLDETYTYKVAVAPGNPAKRTMYRKPGIYNSVVSIERLLRKNIRKELIAKEKAEELLNIVLDVALNSYSSDTESFEQKISKSSNSDDLLTLFTKNVRVVKI